MDVCPQINFACVAPRVLAGDGTAPEGCQNQSGLNEAGKDGEWRRRGKPDVLISCPPPPPPLPGFWVLGRRMENISLAMLSLSLSSAL